MKQELRFGLFFSSSVISSSHNFLGYKIVIIFPFKWSMSRYEAMPSKYIAVFATRRVVASFPAAPFPSLHSSLKDLFTNCLRMSAYF